MLDTAYHTAALDAWRRYNGSDRQEQLRREAPVEVGAVYWNPQEDTAENLRYELQRMRDTGFTFVRFHCIHPLERSEGDFDCSYGRLRLDIAAECGLKAYVHAELDRPSHFALERLGLTPAEASALGVLDERVAEAVRVRTHAVVRAWKDHPALVAWPLSGEPPATEVSLAGAGEREAFKHWLQERYASPEAIHEAWIIYPDLRREVEAMQSEFTLAVRDWDDAVELGSRIAGKQAGAVLATTGLSRKAMYGVFRDLVRFRADRTEAIQRAVADLIREVDTGNLICYGSHQLFYANGELAWDQHRCGRTADMHFSSIHLSWHFEPVLGELDRPHYLQARLTNDIFKGGYTNCYETVGGPVQYSGGYGNHMDRELMRKLMCNFLAAGNEGSAFWCWQARPGGLEAGEYGLVSASGRITEWAEEAGLVARAMQRYRHEIWNWSIDPELGILRSWDSETVPACEPKRYQDEPGPTPWSSGPSQNHVRAWIGASRAAIDGQVDFQILTTDEILAGLDGVYPAIYLPHVRCLGDEVLEHLIGYVEAGGRLIADVQLGFEDQWGKWRRQGEGTPMERLFGGWVDTIHDAHTRPQSVDGIDCPGFFGELVTTSARVIRRFATGKPAVTEHRLGGGTATLIGFDAARHCWKPGNDAMQELLVDLYRGPAAPRWRCSLPTTYRRSHPDADHFFIVNDGAARTAVLRVYDHSYEAIADVLDGEQLPTGGSIAIEVPAYSAKWLRCQRRA